jgi:thymidylate synthase (FAD)
VKIIKPSYEILTEIDGEKILKQIEECGRICYRSGDKISDDSYLKFVKNIINRGHESVLEHGYFTVKLTTDRGVLQEIARHRMNSLSVESTRYCNYNQDKFGNEITVIRPCFWEDGSFCYDKWKESCENSERNYLSLLNAGATSERARSVLPNSLATQIMWTCNLRQWRHVFKLRTSKAAHPDMRSLMIPLLKELQQKIPIVFDDIIIEE